MSIETYQTDAALELLKKIGWPEWALALWSNARGALYYDPEYEEWIYRITDGPTSREKSYDPDYLYSVHVTLCLLRNHLREWLAARRAPVETGLTRLGTDGVVAYREAGDEWTEHYDDALLAATREVMAKEQNDG